MPDPISWASVAPYFIAALVLGYLLGSIPFGLLITKLAGKGDIRSIGSGNIGATNVLRTGDKKLAALTLLGDGLKGTVAVILGFNYGGPDLAVCAGLGAFLGHLFPIWLKFKGGKGVATYVGILLGLAWQGFVGFAIIWLSAAFLLRYSSLAALLATLATPVILAYFDLWQYAELMAVLTILAWIKHHENIRRLLKGEESKIGKKS